MKKLLLLTIAMLVAVTAFSQTQKGNVKTKGRLDNDGNVIPGNPLSEVTIKVKDRNAVMSDKRGNFTFPIPDNTYYLENVKKSGYVLTDPDILSKQYTYSPDKLVVVMETKEDQLEERFEINRKIMAAQKEMIDNLRAEVKQLKEENKITEEEYYNKLQEIVDMQNENQQLVEEMVDRYSKIDFDQLSDFELQIKSYILSGDLLKAKSMIMSKGDLTERAEDLKRHQEANAKEREEIAKRSRKLEKSELAAQKKLDDLANDYYDLFEIYKLEHKNDSAAYYLELRAALDTTNVEWILGTGEFIDEFLANNTKTIRYFEKGLEQSIKQYGGQSVMTAKCYTNIGIFNIELQKYDIALEYLEQALSIMQAIDNDNPQIITIYKSIGAVYMRTHVYDKAKKYLEEGLLLSDKITGRYTLDVLGLYGNMGLLDEILGRYEESLENFNNTLEIGKYLFGEDSYMLINTYNNISIVYDVIGDKKNAIDYQEKALQLSLTNYGNEHPQNAYCYQNLGIFYRHINPEKSLQYSNAAIDAYKMFYGENFQEISGCYQTIGEVYSDNKDFDNALFYYEKALIILKNLFGEDNPDTANVFNSIGILYLNQENFTEAIRYYELALDIRRRYFGEIHPEIAKCYFNIGLGYYGLKNYLQAIECFSKSAHVFEHVYGNGTYLAGLSYSYIGDIYDELSDYDKAIEYYQRTLTIYMSAIGEDDQEYIQIKDKISEVQAKLAESKKK